MDADKNFKAIVIGASAGGLAALSFILEKLPGTFSLPLIVVQHRVKDQNYLLEEVLQSKCAIKIKQADEKEKIEPGTVYIAPADYHLLLEQDHTFSLSSDQPVHYSRPSIDVLFESAASAYGKELVGVVLTGANSDGAMGAVAIRQAGGLTIAQSPDEARFPYMPTSAIEAKGISRVCTLPEIQNFLLKLDIWTKTTKL
jgi:two-component system chemotaxis response regulator CheB